MSKHMSASTAEREEIRSANKDNHTYTALLYVLPELIAPAFAALESKARRHAAGIIFSMGVRARSRPFFTMNFDQSIETCRI